MNNGAPDGDAKNWVRAEHRIISREEAVEIVKQTLCPKALRALKEPWYEKGPTATDQWNRPLYLLEEVGPVWYVVVPWGDGLDGWCLRSSRVVVVTKIGGRIVYDGSGHDEG
jgi:hypothetical protein